MNQTRSEGCIQGQLYKNLRMPNPISMLFGILQQMVDGRINAYVKTRIAAHIQLQEISPQDSFLGLW